MHHPTDLSTVRQAIMDYVPDVSFGDEFYTAQMIRSPVSMVVTVFKLLKPIPDLDQPGISILLGCAHLISAHGWGEALPLEAATILSSRSQDLEPPPPPEMPPQEIPE